MKRPDTVVVIIENTPAKKRETYINPVPLSSKDTVIIIRKGKKQDPAKDTVKAPPAVVQKVNPECQCVTMKASTPDTLVFNTYLNYVFTFTNNCKETIWINSRRFSYLFFTPKGVQVRTLRKLQYVKSYKYPDFIPLKPGAKFDFVFGDDPFFEYDLRSGWRYKVTFIYNNKDDKHKTGTTYICTEFRDRFIFVK